jgi:Citrate synthase
MRGGTQEITDLILNAKERAIKETSHEPEPELTQPQKWPINCTVGPGLEGAIACETKVGYVNGAKGWLIYRGYNIFDLCAYSTFEEVSYLLLHGLLPTATQLEAFKKNWCSMRIFLIPSGYY